jgi:metal-dependent amidase/aminoacylase/carboxypeptidase family protein
MKAAERLAGEIVFFAVPAEEFMLGKPELIAKGHFRRCRHGDDDPYGLAR